MGILKIISKFLKKVSECLKNLSMLLIYLFICILICALIYATIKIVFDFKSLSFLKEIKSNSGTLDSSVLITFSGVLVAVLTLLLGLGAFYNYNQIKGIAKKTADKANKLAKDSRIKKDRAMEHLATALIFIYSKELDNSKKTR